MRENAGRQWLGSVLSSIETPLEASVATAMSGLESALKLPIATAWGFAGLGRSG